MFTFNVIFQAKLRGMHEHNANITIPSASSDVKTVTSRIYQAANVLQVPSGDPHLLMFAGQTVSTSNLLLVCLDMNQASLTVNTENIVLGSMIVKDIKNILES